MHITNSVSILGCGWLGFPLAMRLANKGYSIKGSTTSAEKLPGFKKEGIAPFLVHFNSPGIPENLDKFFNSDILIIAVPPGRDSLKHEGYFSMLTSLTNVIPESSIQKVIFLSSASVYGDMNMQLTEKDEPRPDTDAGRRMLAAEEAVLKLTVNK